MIVSPLYELSRRLLSVQAAQLQLASAIGEPQTVPVCVVPAQDSNLRDSRQHQVSALHELGDLVQIPHRHKPPRSSIPASMITRPVVTAPEKLSPWRHPDHDPLVRHPARRTLA